MKKLVVYFILNIIYLITYRCKIKKNKITFISYTSDKLVKDFKLISNRLKNEKEYEIVYILTKYTNTLKGNIKYLFNCIKQVYHVNTSNVVLLDYNNYVISNFKKKEVKVVQLWHASGAIKKFGNDIKREYEIKNYDYVISTSREWKNYYSTAFNVRKENVVITGIPSIDYLFSEEAMENYKKKMINKYPKIQGKKVILFAPTFRGDPIKDIRYERIDLDKIKRILGDKFVIIYKLHPSFGEKNISNDKDIINCNGESIKKLFSITDYLITDYSSIAFEFSILNKPMIFYVPDLERYNVERGIYFNYEEIMPGPICKNENEVINSIIKNEFNFKEIEDFKNKFFEHKDNNSTERTTNFIKQIMSM